MLLGIQIVLRIAPPHLQRPVEQRLRLLDVAPPGQAGGQAVSRHGGVQVAGSQHRLVASQRPSVQGLGLRQTALGHSNNVMLK